MKSQMTIGKKLFLSFGAALALTLVVSLFALQSIGSLGGSLDKAIKVNARKRYLASDMSTVMSDLTAGERGIIARSYMKDKATSEKYNQEFGQSVARFKKCVDEFVPLIETAEARRMIQELQTDVETIAQSHDDLYRLAAGGQIEAAAEVLRTKSMPLILKAKATTEQLVQQQGELMAVATKSAESSVSQNRWITTLMIGLSLLVGAVVVYIVRQINKSLRQAVTELSEGAEQVATAAGQVSASSQSLAQGSSEQAASLEETSASSEEISSMARKNSENSRGAADLVTQSQQKFVQTNQSLDQSVVAMAEINTQSDKIAKIIKVIDEIAFQTNILALNAAVEAARAGEAGMGFAVVADEVRNLAQRCAQAARDTAVLIEESIAKSNDGKAKVDQVAAAIRTITEESAKVKTLVDEVNLGSQEQTSGIEQIGKAIIQMEKVTQQTAANAEESASAAEELTAQSETLKDIVARLTAMVGGGEATNGPARGVHQSAGAANGKAPASRRPGESASGLAALHKAVSRQPKSAEHRAPVLAAHGASKQAFPLEEEFKEF
jgi:methyl-accepting chemotaxis protein/methyl-accepting chemotaxis protein-1 (serine sensor receptor)